MRYRRGKEGISATCPVLLALMVACSTGKPIQPGCSSVQSLVRFDQPSVNLAASGALKTFSSHGGFIEVLTRSEALGSIDSSRLCTAYIEFTDNPVGAALPSDSEPLNISVYTASHCMDLSRDYKIKLHFFNGSAYQSTFLNYAPLSKVNELRKGMIQKRLPKDSQAAVLNSIRTTATDINELFRLTGSSSTQVSNTLAAKVCLEKESSNHQNVCATFQDLSLFKVTVADDTLPATRSELVQLRSKALERQQEWISETNLKKYVDDNPSFRFSFLNESEQMTLSELHTEVRARINRLTLLKELKHVSDELLDSVRSCSEGERQQVCDVLPELTDLIRTQLRGTGLDEFNDNQIADVIESLPAAQNAAFVKMDRTFTAFLPFINSAGSQLNLATRVHSNYRFVTATDKTIDTPDPSQSVDDGRAFLQFDANNLTGDSTGAGVKFIKWSNTPSSSLLGLFLHLALPRAITDTVRAKKGTSSVAHIGFMQEGDSGSVAVVEQIPFFAITSVDGKAISGGSGIRPLPEPIDDPDFADAPGSSALNCSGK